MPENTRVQFDFAPKALAELDRLQRVLKVKTRAEVVRYGLRILQWLIEQLRGGGEIIVKSKDGQMQTVMFPFLPKEFEEEVPGEAAVTNRLAAKA